MKRQRFLFVSLVLLIVMGIYGCVETTRTTRTAVIKHPSSPVSSAKQPSPLISSEDKARHRAEALKREMEAKRLLEIVRFKEVKSRVLKGHWRYVMSVFFSPNGRYLASGSGDNTVRIWDVETGKCLKVLRHEHYVKY